MHFALAQTQGDRSTTVTTTAISSSSPRTSAVPAPSVFLPHAEPSTSRGAGASSAGTSTGPDADGPTDGDCDFGGSLMEEDDMSSEDEYERSGSTFTIAVGMYSFERNLLETSDIHQPSKPVIEYVNLKFVENNFRSIGLDRVFDKNNIMRAELEFESFEVWFSHVKEYAFERDCIRDLRLPLFCHLYLNLYAPCNHIRLQQFLKAFQYIFTSPRGSVYLDELKNVTNALELSPRLAYFRRNKFVYGVSPMFINNLYNFFQINFMLQMVFQEWFDINYIAYEDPKVVFEDYYTNRLLRVNNLVKANAPKLNNNVNTLRTVLWKKTPNSSQNQNNNRKVNNYENERPSTSKDFVGCSSNSSPQEPNSRKLANNAAEDSQTNVTNSELDESTENSEQSSTEEDCLKPGSRRSKKTNIKRKHMKHDRDRPSSYEREARRLKKFCVDDTSLQKKSIDHQENGNLSEESLREGQSTSKQEAVKEERIILRISRKFNRLQVIGSNDKNEPDDPENPIQERSNKEQASNDRKKSRKHRKKRKARGKKKSTTDCLNESSNDTSNNEEQLRKKIKASNRKKSTSDQNSHLCEKSSEVSKNEEKKYKRRKKICRSKATNDDNNTQTNESSSEVSNEEKRIRKRQKKGGKSKSISDNDMQMSGLSDISNYNEINQKLQNKRSKTKSTIDDNHTMSEDEQSRNKYKKNYKSKDRRKFGRIDKDSSLSESYSAEDSLEDSSSLYSSCDEEIEMRKYVRNNKKSAQRLRYESSRRLKHMKVTKIDFQNLDDDLYLSLSRKIILKNCSKLSCSILTVDQKLVIAGSIDSLIYLWKRDNEKSVSDKSQNVLHNIGNTNSSNCSTSLQENNLVEYLDKSTAFVLRGHSGPIFDLAELPSAKILLSASHDKTYRAWDMVSKRCLEVYNEHEHRTWCIAACPYSLQVATGSCDGTSCLWFLNYKRPLRIFVGHLDDILVLKFHPNQVFLATGSSDKTIRVFELTSGECQRVLIGHSDYITCLEFNSENSNYLASTSGSGEIIVWDVPTGEIVWKIRVGNVFFSDLVWLTADILLVSLTSGAILKCDTTIDYLESSCKVIGFDTPFDRLISLRMINNTVYTIGVPDKTGGLKQIPKRNRRKASKMKSEQQKSQKEPSPLSKLFFPQHIIDNNGNSKRPVRGLSSTIPNPPYNFEYQINTNDQFKNSTLPNFLNMNLRSAPFNLTANEISKLSSEYQSENIRLIPAVAITNNLQNAYLLPVQQNVRASNLNSTNFHSTNAQLPSTSKSQKLNKTQGTSKSKNITAKQHNFGNSSLTMHTSIQHMQIKTTTIQEQLHLDDHRDTNMSVQQYLQTTSTNTHKQQTSNLSQVTQPGMSSQVPQNSIVLQEQQVQLQHDVGSNSNVAGTNVQQQQLLQQLQSNKNITKKNVQQRLSPRKNNRSSNSTKRSTPKKSPNK